MEIDRAIHNGGYFYFDKNHSKAQLYQANLTHYKQL